MSPVAARCRYGSMADRWQPVAIRRAVADGETYLHAADAVAWLLTCAEFYEDAPALHDLCTRLATNLSLTLD